MKIKYLFFIAALLFFYLPSHGQSFSSKGYLFIIGGGDRSLTLMESLMNTAKLGSKDYIAVLPMSSVEPDTSYYYIKTDLEQVCNNTIANLNFTTAQVTNQSWLD